VSPGRTLQDALAAELLQGHLAGGYQLRNPPLYEWLLWAVQQLVGPGPLSYLILRYALIATTGILFYVALLRTVGNARLAAAFSLLLVLFFWFGWEIHQSVSHTLALLAAVLALFIVSLVYAERPTGGRALLLGLIIGIGLMAKWSFLLVALSLAAALAITPETRRMYREPRTLLVLAGAALPILPFGLWLATIDPDLVGRRTMPPGRALSLDQALQGVAAFVTGIPLVFLPWIAFVLFFAWRFPKTPPSSPALSQAVAIRLASLTAVMILALMAALLLFAFATGGARHQPLRHPLSLPVFSVRGARSCRPRRATRGGAAFRPEALDRFARRGSRHLFRQARELLCGARRFGGDQPPPLRAVGRRAHEARSRLRAIRDAFAARRRQSCHLFA
jgi:4-amino-4-deoxy-L-arabinose transferase-like glycosyltransferase